MNNKIKNIVVTCVFVVFMAIMVSLCAFKFFNPTEVSESERRPLAQFPENITWESIVNTKDPAKSTIKQFEKYTVDQFPCREFFRSLKAKFQINILQLKENNGFAVQDDYIAKIEPEFNEDLINRSLGRLLFIYDKYIKDNGGNAYFSIVPDKNYFLSKEYGYPGPDYNGLVNKAQEVLKDVHYIDIFDTLQLEDYYRTDTHWSQDKIVKVAKKLAEEMGFEDRMSWEYTENHLEGFKGVYYAQSALYPKPDTLSYLTNNIINDCTVFDFETQKTTGLYREDLFGGKDGYDFFLAGTRALLRIDNPHATTDKDLIVFRDSFGSSLSPLLAEGYRSIYVVDIRYVVPEILDKLNFINFEGSDVLFIYSPLVLNSTSFK